MLFIPEPPEPYDVNVTRLQIIISNLMNRPQTEFYARLLMACGGVEITDAIPTACVAYQIGMPIPRVLVGKQLMERCDDNEVAFALIHESFHLLRTESVLAKGRDMEVWNAYCADPIINTWVAMLMTRSGTLEWKRPDSYALKPINGVMWIDDLAPYAFSNADVQKELAIRKHDGDFSPATLEVSVGSEDLWARLTDEQKSGGRDENGQLIMVGTNGNALDSIIFIDENGEEVAPHELPSGMMEEIQSNIERICDNISKAIGTTPLGVENNITDIAQSPKNWARHFVGWAHSSMRADRTITWMKASRTDDMLPGIKAKTRASFNVIVDVSGSVDDKSFKEFLGVLLQLSKNMHINILQVDCEVKGQGRSAISKFDHRKVKKSGFTRTGYGGTDMNPGLEVYKKYDPHATGTIIFTDGYIPPIQTDLITNRLAIIICRNGEPDFPSTPHYRVFHID